MTRKDEMRMEFGASTGFLKENFTAKSSQTGNKFANMHQAMPFHQGVASLKPGVF
jgi:hypothetical protein